MYSAKSHTTQKLEAAIFLYSSSILEASILTSGLADSEERFFVVRYNLGTYYARLRDSRRSIAARAAT